MLPFWRELPDLHWEAGHPEVVESSLSARASAFGARSRMVVGLPWCSREYELFYELDMENAHAALQAVRGRGHAGARRGRVTPHRGRLCALVCRGHTSPGRLPFGALRAAQGATGRDAAGGRSDA